MTATPCGSCKAPVGDSAYLCSGCTGKLAELLRQAADIAPDLDDAVARLLRRGGGGGKRGGDENPLPYDPGAGLVRAGLRLVIAGWARRVSHGGDEVPAVRGEEGYRDIAAMAQFVIARLDRARQHPTAAEQLDRTRQYVGKAVAVIDRQPERIYVGPCPQCGADLLGQPGASVIECGGCKFPWEVSTRRDAMGDRLWDTLGTVQWCVTAASALGVTLSEHTIRTWVKRGKLVKHGDRAPAFGSIPQAVYRFGDVMKLAADRPERTRITSV